MFIGQVDCFANVGIKVVEFFDFRAVIVFGVPGNLVLGCQVFPFSLTDAIALVEISLAGAFFIVVNSIT